MLVISRKSAESFIIGDNITVRILEINGDKVKIGIDAPRDVKIIREEIRDTEMLNMEAQVPSSGLNKNEIDMLSKKLLKKHTKD